MKDSFSSQWELYFRLSALHPVQKSTLYRGFAYINDLVLKILRNCESTIQNRSKEFAILESVGMTRKQIKKMIVFESLGYSFLSIVIALIIGLPASYYVFTNFNIYGIPFVFPVIKTLLLFIAIIIVCVVTSLFVFSKSKSETVIELLRKDEA